MIRTRKAGLGWLHSGLCAVLLLGVASRVDAATCSWTEDKTPSRAVAPDLWTGLQPTEHVSSDGTGLHPARDTTDFTTNGGFTHSRPFWRSIDAEDGWVFAGYNLGMHVLDARGAKAEAPPIVGTVQIESLPILNRNPHDFFIITDVDVVDGDNDVVLMTGWDGVGLAAFDTSVKTGPLLVYQDGGAAGGEKFGQGVYGTRINGRYYGFLAAQRRDGAGLWFYDLSTILGNPGVSACVEARPDDVNCPGVFKRKLSNDSQSHVDGAGSDQLGHFVAFSGGRGGVTGLEIWNVSNPGNPFRILTGFPDRRVDGVAMWVQGSKFYLAMVLRSPDEVRIYDVSCLRTGCTVSPFASQPLYSFPAPGPGLSSRGSASHSVSGGKHYLHIGRSQVFAVDELQAQWLLDVTDPNNPVELTGGNPQNGNLGQPTITVEGEEVGYWSWYYACSPSGSNMFEPADGVVSDGYLFRAGGSILDVHEVLDVGPSIQVSVNPGTTYQGVPVQATASAFNCTPTVGGWNWSADGGTVSGSGSTVDITWSTTGTKTVSASNSACGGAVVTPATVTVQQAAPSIGSVTSDVSSALICSPVTFTAADVAGKPTLSHSWEILDGAGTPVPGAALDVSQGGLTAEWDTAAATQPTAGDYRARLSVSNDVGSDTEESSLVNLTSPGVPTFDAVPIDATVSFGDVDFTANATGATEWLWDFGDGTQLQTEDPVLGPAPTHSYDAIGSYDVTVQIRNCIHDTWVTSDVKTVDIAEINPLEVITFQAESNGPFGPFYDVGQQISFVTEVGGNPQFFDYDWDGDGSFEQTGLTSAAGSHTYQQAGFYRPVIRIRRDNAEVTFQHIATIDVSESEPQPDPSITLSGPTAADVGESSTFGATARNCTASSGGWNWTATGGGTINGSGATVSIRWSNAGSYTVQVTNTGCTGASASRNIRISDDSEPPPPAKLTAAFASAPATPKAGEPITFDGTVSEGTPDAYFWDFGDGDEGQGAQVSHTYSLPGTYTVILTIEKDDPSCRPFLICTDTVTKTVTVAGSEPEVGANGCSDELADDPEKLCLMDGRFVAEVEWRDQHNANRTGTGKGVAYGENGQGITGFFWFFTPKNVELLLKVLDATDPVTGEGNYWVFYGGLSNVFYELTVTDTETGQVETYQNPEGSLCGIADTGAFPVGPVDEGSGSAVAAARLDFASVGASAATAAQQTEGNVLLLHDGRFAVTVDWANLRSPDQTGPGIPIAGTKQSGYFWFFNQRNLELAVKVVDARALGDGFWIFWASLSDVQYDVRVEDLETGDVWEHRNPQGQFCGGSDARAFKAQ